MFFRRDQKFYRPVVIEQWMIVVYERQQRYNMETVNNLIRGFGMACDKVGMYSLAFKLAYVR
jgi:eukaryotic translation initiation factor 2C